MPKNRTGKGQRSHVPLPAPQRQLIQYEEEDRKRKAQRQKVEEVHRDVHEDLGKKSDKK